MGLSAGQRLGPYEVVSPIGAGGMGEVYRALDTRLERTVAIKVLHSAMVASPDVKARFEREARTISQLNHPNICVLHDIGHEGDIDYLVMEFLEGEPLSDRLVRGALPLEQVVKIGCEVAEALDRAHRAGIVHRDLKPGNVMLTKTGAKLLDFGLAKPQVMGAAAGSGTAPLLSAAMTVASPTPNSPLTQQGALVGTVQYMSPEQIQGMEADARSDIFAFGAMLYEMATGKRPFQGNSQIKVASAILEDQPLPMVRTKAATPPALEYLVEMCLQKNRDERMQSAHDVKLQLYGVVQSIASSSKEPAIARSTTYGLAALAGVLAIAALVAGTAWWKAPNSSPPMRVNIDAPEGTRFETMYRNGPPMISPDATRFAFTASRDGTNSLWVRSFDKQEATELTGTQGAFYPFWSPDGKSIGFFMNAKLWRMQVDGGSPLEICDVVQPRGGAWLNENTIIFAPNTSGPIFSVSTDDPKPKPVTSTDTHEVAVSDRWPFPLPDGKHFLFVHTPAGIISDNNEVRMISVSGGEEKTLLRGRAYTAQYAAGWLLVDFNASLRAWSFDAKTGSISPQPVEVLNSVGSDDITAAGSFFAAGNGYLLYQQGATATGDRHVWVDATGKQLQQISDPSFYGGMRLSPDESRLMTPKGTKGQDDKMWIWDLSHGTRTPVESVGFGGYPAWTPDGKRVFYSLQPSGTSTYMAIHSSLLDGSQKPLTVVDHGREATVADVTADGKHLLYIEESGESDTGHGSASHKHKSDLNVMSLDGSAQPSTLVENVDQPSNARLRPEKNDWLAYQASESGRSEIYLTRFPSPAAKYQVSHAGGTQPVWSKDGKTLYYLDPAQKMVAVHVTAAADGVQLGESKTLFATGIRNSIPADAYDVTRDGRFLLVNSVFSNSAPLSLLTDWKAELKK